MPDIWERIVEEAVNESPLWKEALRSLEEREPELVFSTLGPEEMALGIETIYEGYLVHYGRSRLFTPGDSDLALLLGDYLYARGLVHIATSGNPVAVEEIAMLLALCANLRAEDSEGDGPLWAATIAKLGRGELGGATRALDENGDPTQLLALARDAAGAEATDRALTSHALRFG